MIALVTYNKLLPYQKGANAVCGTKVLVLPETFVPKMPASVRQDDPNWQELLRYKKDLNKVIIFAGKKSSGALEIVDLACESFADQKKCLFFVLCDHELNEKVERLKYHGIPATQYVSFADGYLPCQEAPLMKGYMMDFIDRVSNAE